MEGEVVRLIRATTDPSAPGRSRVERFAGTADRAMTTDEVLRLTRGGSWDDEPPGVLD